MSKDTDDLTVTTIGLGLIVLFVGGLVIGLSALFGLIGMLLWNFVTPVWWAEAPQLSFLQAWGTMFLLGIIVSIFKGLIHISSKDK